MPTIPSPNKISGKDKPTGASSGGNIPNQKGASLVFLEQDVSLSQSIIWQLQRKFYVQRGLRAWTEDMVPNYITNNPLIAERYARIVFNFLCDCLEPDGTDAKPITPQNPLRILELGAGPGKFSYLFLRHLADLLRARNIPLASVRYYMTDCAESLLQVWTANSYFAEFAREGMLEFALFQAAEEVSFSEKKTPSWVGGPLVLIANYVFDSLPQDAFVIQGGEILEALISTQGRGDARAESLAQLQFSYRNAVVPSNRYENQSWNDVLEFYRTRLSSATVLFPRQALKTIQEVLAQTDGRMLLLAADKGYAHEEQLCFSQGPPTVEFHGSNCFSQTVNFHAISKCFEAQGGDAFLPEKHSADLSICAFLQGRSGDQFPATRKACKEVQGALTPDDLFSLLGWLNAHMDEVAMPQILAILRLTHWDSVALMRLFPAISRQVRKVVREREDLRNAVMNTWANHYPVSPGENVMAFNCGVILLELSYFNEALSMFQQSLKAFGGSAATSYNMGLCLLGLNRQSEALTLMVEACELDPEFEPARNSRLRLEQEIKTAEIHKNS